MNNRHHAFEAAHGGNTDEDRGSDQALFPTKHCLKFGCSTAALTKRGQFWCCPNCGASYGAHPHPDLDKARGRKPRKIVTRNIWPPIGDRRFDWCAYYDGEEECQEYGYGVTEAEAIADLKANWPDETDEDRNLPTAADVRGIIRTSERWIGFDPPMPNADYEVKIIPVQRVDPAATADPVPEMPNDELIAELRYHEREYPELIHGQLCGQVANTIATLQARVTELELERDYYRTRCGELEVMRDEKADRITELEATNAALRASTANVTDYFRRQRDELREALKPFVDAKAHYNINTIISDLCRARTALANTEPNP